MCLLHFNRRGLGDEPDALRGGASKEKVTIIGSGNWGSAITKIISRNVLDARIRHRGQDVGEEVDGKKLTEIINTEHENVKYLPVSYFPFCMLPDLLRLVLDVLYAQRSRAPSGLILLFCVLPHLSGFHFCRASSSRTTSWRTPIWLRLARMPRCSSSCFRTNQHRPQMTTMAKGCRAISLIKGIEFGETGPILISNMIKDAMNGMDVSVSWAPTSRTRCAHGPCSLCLPSRRAQHRCDDI